MNPNAIVYTSNTGYTRQYATLLGEKTYMEMTVNNKPYSVLRLLGKGKGGYSYLVTDGQKEYVLKQIHHEPCDYYQFGDKLQSELRDYCDAIASVQQAMDNYDPAVIGYVWDDSNPRIQLEPRGKRGYIEMRAIK